MTARPRPKRSATKPRVRPPTKVPEAPDAARLRLELDIHREELANQNEELRRANASLLAAKERYAELYDAAPIAYFTLDPRGAIVEANVAGASLLGIGRSFMFGRPFEDVVVAASRESFRRFRARLFELGGRLAHETTVISRGGRLAVRIEATLLADSAGGEQCLFCVTDETERRLADRERRELDAQIAESRRLESLVTLASGVAHDFNNLLAIVLAYSELLEDDTPTASQAGYLREIHDAATRAAHLSRQMLSYSGSGRIRTEPVDVSAVVRALQPVLTRAAPASALLLDLAGHLPPVAAEKEQLAEVVLSLVANAVEAIAPGGTIIVRTRLEVSDAANDGPARVVLEVSDDGRGMSEATRARAFDPFFTTKFAGRGLGLAVVHGRVRGFGGTAVIEAPPHGGTTVRVSLPVVARPVGESEPH